MPPKYDAVHALSTIRLSKTLTSLSHIPPPAFSLRLVALLQFPSFQTFEEHQYLPSSFHNTRFTMSIRLIDVKTLRLKSFNSQKAPPYAILSHTWVEDEEVSFQEMCRIAEEPSHPATRKSGYRKIWETCRVSLIAHKLDYAWVDTCCIDKSSSAELSEAINSMFKWYRDAAVCFAYLSDYYSFFSKPEERMRKCKWFTRGWCLQELIAPKSLIFYDRAWKAFGSRHDLQALIASITYIDKDVLANHAAMYSMPIARRMSWASSRVTTRVEDTAYCLLGIFDINMPMLYGEGDKAFTRLQEEIIRRFNDTSIFLFTPQVSSASRSSSTPQATCKYPFPKSSSSLLHNILYRDDSHFSAAHYLEELSSYEFCGMFAHSPVDFHACGDVVHKHGVRAPLDRQEFSVTNRGVQLGRQLLVCIWGKDCFFWETAFRHSNRGNRMINGAIFLRKVGRNLFARVLLPIKVEEIIQARAILHDDVCVLPHITPSTQDQIYTTLEAVLRIRSKQDVGVFVSFSEPTPIIHWDDSGKLFLFPETFHITPGSFRPNYYTTAVEVTVKEGEFEDVNFYLRVLIVHPPCYACVLLSQDPVTMTYTDGGDLFDEYSVGKLSARSHESFDGISVDAHVYGEPTPRSGSQMYMYTCCLEISQS